jgi:cytochrome c oxidase cbb3-type subunit III
MSTRLPSAPLSSKPLLICALLVSNLCGCEREERQYRTDPPVAAALQAVAPMPDGIAGAPPDVYVASGEPYNSNAYDLSQGKQLYGEFNCNGCHAEGGGASGPAFLDGWWRYGPQVVSIFVSIRDGRPRGMPAFGSRLTTGQIWQLAGYVQTIGAYSAKTAAPARDDDKQTRPAENRAPAAILFDEGPNPVHLDQGPTP